MENGEEEQNPSKAEYFSLRSSLCTPFPTPSTPIPPLLEFEVMENFVRAKSATFLDLACTLACDVHVSS